MDFLLGHPRPILVEQAGAQVRKLGLTMDTDAPEGRTRLVSWQDRTFRTTNGRWTTDDPAARAQIMAAIATVTSDPITVQDVPMEHTAGDRADDAGTGS